MTDEEARIIHKRYAELEFTHDENNAIYDCYMQGINRDGHVWVTWTDVERLLCDLKDVCKYAWHDLRKNPDDLPEVDGLYCVAVEWTDGIEVGFGQWETIYGYGSGWSALMPNIQTVIAWRETEPFEEADK